MPIALPLGKVENTIDKYLPKSCCGCYEPRTGVLIITGLQIIGAMYSFFAPVTEVPTSLYNWSILLNVVGLGFSICGFYGALYYNYKATKVNAYFNFVRLFLSMITFIAVATNVKPIFMAECTKNPELTPEVCEDASGILLYSVFFGGIIGTAFNVYLILVTWSFYRSLESGNQGFGESEGAKYFEVDNDIQNSDKV